MSLEDIIADKDISDAISALLTNEFLGSLYNAAEMISGNFDSTPTQYPNLLRNFLNATVSLFTLTVPTQGTSEELNFVKTIDQHNEGLMFQFPQIAKILQQAFIMETTSLFFSYQLHDYLPVLAEQGIVYKDSYDDNYDRLHDIFKKRFNHLHDLFEGALITDGFKEELDYISANKLKNSDATKGGSGLPNGNWTDSCDLYVWSGLGYVNKYDGSWDGATLKAQCSLSDSDSVAEISNTLTSECSNAITTNIDYYSESNSGNLFCDWYNVDYLKGIIEIPHDNKGFNHWETSGQEILSLQLDNPSFAYLWSRDCSFHQDSSGSVIYDIDNWDTTPAVMFQYKARSGALSTFVVLIGDGVYTQILCMNNDSWCSNEQSQMGLEIWIGGDHIRYIEVQKYYVEGFQILN